AGGPEAPVQRFRPPTRRGPGAPRLAPAVAQVRAVSPVGDVDGTVSPVAGRVLEGKAPRRGLRRMVEENWAGGQQVAPLQFLDEWPAAVQPTPPKSARKLLAQPGAEQFKCEHRPRSPTRVVGIPRVPTRHKSTRPEDLRLRPRVIESSQSTERPRPANEV